MQATRRIGSLAVLLGLAAGLPALAQVTLPKEGSYEVIACWSGTSNEFTVNKDHSANSYEMLGTIVSVPPGGLGDRSSFRCVGMNTVVAGKSTGGNACEVTDPDGDKRMNAFQIHADGKVTREMVTGTGKYEGMTVTNTVAPMAPPRPAKPGTFQGCNRQTGSYKLR